MLKTVTLIAAVLALLATALLGIVFVPLLRRAKYGQPIKEIGPTWHKNKAGTPTMGGLMLWIGVGGGFLCGCILIENTLASNGYIRVWRTAATLLGCALAFGLIGFIDDWIKVARKRNAGLSAPAKLLMQVFVTSIFLLQLQQNNGEFTTAINLPFFGTVEFGIWYYVVSFFLIVGMVNAVNLNDGVDGLCSGVTFVAALGFMVLAMLLVRTEISGDRFIVTLFAAATAGGCIGFLFWNFHPAKIFMGDTGSMFLGGAVVAMAYGMGRPELLIPVGIVYLWEAVSVMLQVAFFKLTHGRRLFKMTPIHHSFEMSGWSEEKIVAVFCGVGVMGTLLAILFVYLQ